jgi:hypothetical protein
MAFELADLRRVGRSLVDGRDVEGTLRVQGVRWHGRRERVGQTLARREGEDRNDQRGGSFRLGSGPPPWAGVSDR